MSPLRTRHFRIKKDPPCKEEPKHIDNTYFGRFPILRLPTCYESNFFQTAISSCTKLQCFTCSKAEMRKNLLVLHTWLRGKKLEHIWEHCPNI